MREGDYDWMARGVLHCVDVVLYLTQPLRRLLTVHDNGLGVTPKLLDKIVAVLLGEFNEVDECGK